MKTVGIITMHRVVNCGLQLQTYALAKMVDAFGYRCTIIDYLYPDLHHYSRRMDHGNLHSMQNPSLRCGCREMGAEKIEGPEVQLAS